MNISFGLLPALPDAPRDKKEKNRLLTERALGSLNELINSGLLD